MTISTEPLTKRNKKRNNKSTSSLHGLFLCARILYILLLSLNFQHLSYPSWHGLGSHLGSNCWYKRDLDGKIFSVKQHITLNQHEESRTLILSKRNWNPLWQEYTTANKFEQGHGEVVSWKNYFPLPCNSSSSFFCSSCSVNKSVQGKTHVLSTAIFASRHKTSLAPSNRPPTAAALYYMVVYTVPANKRDWGKKQKWCCLEQPWW